MLSQLTAVAPTTVVHVAADPVAAASLGWTILYCVLSSIVGGVATGVVIGLFLGGLKSRVEKNEDDIKEVAGEASRARSRIHRDVDELKLRLKDGDTKFERHVERIAAIATRLEGTADQLKTTQSSLGQFVTRGECEREHQNLRTMMGAKA